MILRKKKIEKGRMEGRKGGREAGGRKEGREGKEEKLQKEVWLSDEEIEIKILETGL